MDRTTVRIALAGILFGLVLPVCATGQGAPAVRKVLVLQSLDRGSMVFDTFTAEFRTALQDRTHEPVTLVEFVVAPAGFTEAPEQPMIDYLQSIFADQQPPALIITVGGPAARFVRDYRQRLFPKTPVLFSAVEQRWVAGAALAGNETAVTVSIDYTRILDDILQLLPGTRNVFVVTGTGPLSAFWNATLQRDFAPYQNRLNFIWSSDLSYEQVLQRAATLPRHSAIYYISSGTFASGGWQSEQRTLADFSARANTPVFGAHSVWLGAGIVGGRLLDIDGLGARAAEAAVRILDGATAGRITVPAVSMGPATFDARELAKWKIPVSRLPMASVLQFQAPDLWHDYRAEVLTTVVVMLESLLIIGLLYERRARRRAEVESRRNLTLAADANRRAMTSALAGSIAHELSQPLNSILHNAEAADMLLASNRATPDTLREIVADIRLADVRATEIINRHRAMLRNRPINKQAIDIHGVVRESVAFVANDVNARYVRLDVDLPAYPCLVNGDQVLLQQVVVNLMMNAIDAMADTPAPQRRVTIRNEVTQAGVTVSVRDAGAGLPPSLQARLFEPFVTNKESGLGIGLTIARTIVEAHHGRLDARNNPDGGATFVVTLPWYAAAALG